MIRACVVSYVESPSVVVWQLHVNDDCIAITSVKRLAELFQEIADALNHEENQ